MVSFGFDSSFPSTNYLEDINYMIYFFFSRVSLKGTLRGKTSCQ